MNARFAAVKTLLTVIEEQHSLTAALAETKSLLRPEERPLCQEICYGVLRHYWTLAAIAAELVNKPLDKRNADLQVALLAGLYQMREMRIPDHAVLMETVALADELGKGWGKGLLNATLRRYQRERAEIDQAIAHNEEAHFAHPAWLIRRLRGAWADSAEMILAANNTAPPLTLRTNSLHTTREGYLAALQDVQIDARAAALSDTGIYLTSAQEIETLPGFAEGLFSVQDEAAQLVSGLLDLTSDLRVLDACAAPGGKCSHILELQPDLREVTALDVDRVRLARVAQNLTRLGVTARLLAGDAIRPIEWWDGVKFDRILVDAPCSGTGVIRRNPDIKLLRREEDIAKLSSQQRKLLDALWPLLNDGGLLVYATCSVLPEENWLMVSRFISETDDAVEKPIKDGWGEAVAVGRQLLPESLGHDGFYYARLEKR